MKWIKLRLIEGVMSDIEAVGRKLKAVTYRNEEMSRRQILNEERLERLIEVVEILIEEIGGKNG